MPTDGGDAFSPDDWWLVDVTPVTRLKRQRSVPIGFELDVAFYRTVYRDLRTLSTRKLKKHWESQGWREGRFPSRRALWEHAIENGITPDNFNHNEYLALNPDISSSGDLSFDEALLHYVTRGHDEGRMSRIAQLDEAIRESQRARFVNNVLAPLGHAGDIEKIAALHFGVKKCTPTLTRLQEWSASVRRGNTDLVGLLEQWLTEIIAHDRQPLGRWTDAGKGLTGDPEGLPKVLGIGARDWRRDWEARMDTLRVSGGEMSSEVSSHSRPSAANGHGARAPHSTRALVTAISSVYRADEYIERHLESLAAQTIAADVEFAFGLVQPSEFVQDAVTDFVSNHPLSFVHCWSDRKTVYEVWNALIRGSSASLVTNVNCDDLRSPDSLEIQHNFLTDHPHIDVAYQDVFLALEPNLPWGVVEGVGLQTHLSDVTYESLLEGENAPHSAPMWRRDLHSKIGWFDASLESAGDLDFWLRCAACGIIFGKMAEMHAGYYLNPSGLSTSPRSPAHFESEMVRYRHLMAALAGGLFSWV